jgi:hypothetical protein
MNLQGDKGSITKGLGDAHEGGVVEALWEARVHRKTKDAKEGLVHLVRQGVWMQVGKGRVSLAQQ